ncbi:MAG: SDR family oxidoreductase [Erysipelotrichaceae bacterium]|nr:SDR family oxidoreductase [Erysipelotrichaceae bacterium]
MKNRTCVLFGGTGEILRTLVRDMLTEGMNVILVTHNPETGREMIEEFAGYPGKLAAVSNHTAYDDLYGKIREEYGSVDVIISKTGGLQEPVPFEEVDPEQMNRALQQQVTNVMKNIQSALPYLKESKAARIVLFSTVGSLSGYEKENIIDSVSKGAVNAFTYALARQLAAYGITVNCVAFSGMMQDHAGVGLDSRNCLEDIPLGRIGTGEDIAGIVEYLISEEAGFMTGEVIRMAGGLK